MAMCLHHNICTAIHQVNRFLYKSDHLFVQKKKNMTYTTHNRILLHQEKNKANKKNSNTSPRCGGGDDVQLHNILDRRYV